MSPANIEARAEERGPADRPGVRRRRSPALQRRAPGARPRHGRRPRSRHPEVLARVQAEVDAANAHLSRVEQIKRFRVLARRVAAGRRRAHADDEAQAQADRREVRRRDRRPLRLDSRYGMAERRLHGLQRVLGVNALFSTAYGNVGSSIYYALGLVASFALGPHAGGVRHHRRHLLPDGRHLRRGDGDVPRGRRLVVLRAPRLQRVLVVLRRLGADAQLHDHDRHLGVLRAALPRRAVRRDALRHSPGDIVFGIGVVVVLARSTWSASRSRPA